VQREDVGVKLKVTPQISEGESVLLELELEISDTDANQIGDVNLLGPTLNKSLVSNKVLVRDGSTAVLAGLIRDSNTRKRSQPPILGDIPVVGFLFRSKANTRTKRNMVVLVTPTIIKDGQDHDRVTDYKVDEFHKTNLEELWQGKSFFKKVKQKANNAQERTAQRSTRAKNSWANAMPASLAKGTSRDTMRGSHDTELCGILLRNGWVHKEQIDEALELQKLKQKSIREILLDLGYVDEEHVLDALGEQFDLPGRAQPRGQGRRRADDEGADQLSSANTTWCPSARTARASTSPSTTRRT
jgi:hypothetical protein